MKDLFGGREERIEPFGGENNDNRTDESFDYDEVNEIDPSASRGFSVGDGVYCPAFSVLMGTVFAGQNPEQLQVGDRRLTWWEDSSLTPKWPVTLVNPLTWTQSNQMPDDVTRARLDMSPEDMFVFADSGGFQVKSFPDMCVVDSPDLHSWEEKRIMPERLLEWQAKNASAGAILDFSPYKVESNQGKTEGIGDVDRRDFYDVLFEPNLETTIDNAERMYDHRQRIGAEKFKLYNVLHGIMPFDETEDPRRYIREWYNAVKDIGHFDGWGVGTGSTNIGKLAVNLAFIAENIDEDHLHFFGTGSLGYRAVIEYWRLWKGDEFAVTSDSTSFEVGSQYRQFFNTLIHGNDLSVSSRAEDRENIIADVTPCTCSVCHHMERMYGPEWVWDRDDAQIGVAINLHNLNQLFQRHRMVKTLVRGTGWELPELYEPDSDSQPFIFWKVFDKIFSNETVHLVWTCMRFLKRAREDSVDQACDDFVFRSRYGESEGPCIEEQTVNSFMEW